MVIPIGIVFALLPETPWWLASKGKLDKARKVLQLCNGRRGLRHRGTDCSFSPFHLDTCSPVLSSCADLIIGSHDLHGQDRTPNCRNQQGGRELGYLPRPKSPTIRHRRMAENYPAVCRLNRVQYVRCVLL
jgi:hypothetical protein